MVQYLSIITYPKNDLSKHVAINLKLENRKSYNTDLNVYAMCIALHKSNRCTPFSFNHNNN